MRNNQPIETATENLVNKIIGIGIRIHKTIGAGFVEKIYQRILYLEFKKLKIKFTREEKISIKWNDNIVGYQVVDFKMEDKLLIEIKAVSKIEVVHIAQMVSYLKAANIRLGLILNFGTATLEIKRVIN